MRWLAPPTSTKPSCSAFPTPKTTAFSTSMQRLANRVRRVWGGRVIGVTGSAGKTTTKECVAAVLAKKFEVLKTTGNLNNHFGVPLQLLRLEPQHEVAVLEMGMNHAGEITALAKIAEPNWAVVSNVAPVHLEFFPDGIAGIARAKFELVASLPSDGYAILNADDERVAAFARGMGERALLYGTDAASLRARRRDSRGRPRRYALCSRRRTAAPQRAPPSHRPPQRAECARRHQRRSAQRHRHRHLH